MREIAFRLRRGVAVPLLGTALLSGVLSACGNGSEPMHDGSAPDPGTSQPATSAAPGKYRTLPDPCGALAEDTLRKLLPGLRDYAGQATLTFDTDRRAGCEWSADGTDAHRRLHIDFERGVSYAPDTSDEAEAAKEYQERLAGGAAGSQSASRETTGVVPRPLTGLGDEAFEVDELHTGDGSVHRDVTLICRKANVIITVEYIQSPLEQTSSPAPGPLEDGARQAAQKIIGTLG